jgi:hypothetical protein
MLPLLRTMGQRFMFEFHRYSALASALAAIVFAGLELFASLRTGAPPPGEEPEVGI